MEEAPSASRYGPLGAFSCPRGGECSRLVLPFHACLVLASSHQADGRPLRGRLMGVVPAPQAPPCPPLFLRCAFLLVSFGSYVSAPPRLAPPSSGPAPSKRCSGARTSLISSTSFPRLALRVDSVPSATATQASPPNKNNGEKRTRVAGSHRSLTPHPTKESRNACYSPENHLHGGHPRNP